MGFSDFVGHEDAKLALILNAIEPKCGGVLFAGERGSGKTTLARLFKKLLPEGGAFITVPLNVTEDALLGTIDVEATIKTGVATIQRGLLSRAHDGVIFIDDVNLLSPESVSLVLETSGRKENIIEREGLSTRHPADFILLSTMDPEEGLLSPHLLDRFGMCVLWKSVNEKAGRLMIVKQAMVGHFSSDQDSNSADDTLRQRIKNCGRFMERVTLSSDVMDYIAKTCLENVVAGHRADIFLFYATKAYAAYCGDTKAAFGHVDAVAPLVLLHRKRSVIRPEDEKPQERDLENKEQEKQPDKNQNRANQEQNSPGKERLDTAESSAANERDSSNYDTTQRETALREEVFNTGDAFTAKRFFLRQDRLKRISSGRRTKTRSKDKGGRYVRSILSGDEDVAIDATIRASAPYQKIRERQQMLVIHERDIRYKQREKKTGHLVIFAVDGSGSMGAQRRMTEAKGAIQSLLMDCYQKRDKVAMLVFRKDKAEIVLPPTSSVENASRRLKEIPTGGKTPLTAGLLEAYGLIKRFSKRSPETRFLLVIITDGRANHTLSELPIGQEIAQASQLLSEISTIDCIVVDTENKRTIIKADLAVTLAAHLSARYCTIEDLKADYLVEMVKREKD